MVSGNLRKKKYMVIAGLVIAIFLFGNVVSAAKMKISAQEAEKIKTVLGITQTLLNISKLIVNDNDLATVLNKAISVGQTGTDATYGLLVLSALNEMELMDLVLSQRYKTEARDYFNQVLKEKTDLLAYWKGVGFDIPRVASGYITGPIAGLTLNSFAITDKAIAIFGEFHILKQMKLYDGLWRYFDERRNGESHLGAWELAEPEMGWAAKSTSFHSFKQEQNQKDSQLEQQFSALWDKWGPYTTPYGISEKYKEQARGELRDTLVMALETQSFAQATEEAKPSLLDRLISQFIKLKDMATALINQINPFKAGPIVDLSRPEPEIITEAELGEIQEIEITENSSPLIEKLMEDSPQETLEPEEVQEESQPQLESESEPKIEPVLPPPAPEPALAPVPKPAPTPGPVFCERDSGNPTRFRVLINEVAWMGTNNSANDEWIELKNIWGIPVKLNGWQLLDKDQQIKIIFGESDIIPANGYYLLERTDDNSMPDAKADLIYTGALGNTDEALYLFDDQCNIEDEVLANPDWSAGDNSLKKPMERFDVLDWYSGASTPGSENTSPPVIRSSAGVSAPSPPSAAASLQIFITETYIESPDSQKDDFVELYNPNLEAIDLTDWYLQRKTEGAQDFSSYITHELFAGKIIGAQDYFLIANASSSFATSADVVTTHPLTENNTLVLKNNQQEIIDQVSTNGPAIGKSYGRKWSSLALNYTDDFEVQIPTPRAQNQNSVVEDDGGREEFLLVVINEIAWMGTATSSADEWIELYNSSTSSVDIDGWRLSSSDADGPDITFSSSTAAATTIPAQGFYLIERTDDSAVSDVLADWTGAFGNGLSNTNCEVLSLYDNSGSLIDRTACLGNNWPGGEASPNYISMERIANASGADSQNWASNNLITKNGFDKDGNPINGTPKAENSVAKDYTVLSGGITFGEDFTLRRLGSPYISDGPINVLSGVTLSIEPGVIIKLKHGSSRTPYAELKVEGSLEALGGSEPEQKIVFTSYKDDGYGGDTNNDGDATQPTAGDWDWVYFKDSVSNLQNVIVRYGGKLHSSSGGEFPSYTYGSIYVDGGGVTIENSMIGKSQTIGIWLKNSNESLIDGVEILDIEGDWGKPAAIFVENSSPIIKNSTFKDNNIGIFIESSATSTIENNSFENNQTPIKTNTLLASFSGNTAQNNNLNGILVSSLGFSDTVNQVDWQKENLPYILESSATIASGKTLNIQPGVTVKLKSGGRIYVNGTLRAEGTENEKITFTSLIQTSAGAWDFISFSASSTNSILDNVIVRYGGWYNVFQGGENAKSGAIKADGVALALKNSLIENNLFAGLHLVNSTSTIGNTIFKDHAAKYGQLGLSDSAAIYLENSTTTLDNVTFMNNSIDIFP